MSPTLRSTVPVKRSPQHRQLSQLLIPLCISMKGHPTQLSHDIFNIDPLGCCRGIFLPVNRCFVLFLSQIHDPMVTPSSLSYIWINLKNQLADNFLSHRPYSAISKLALSVTVNVLILNPALNINIDHTLKGLWCKTSLHRLYISLIVQNIYV